MKTDGWDGGRELMDEDRWMDENRWMDEDRWMDADRWMDTNKMLHCVTKSQDYGTTDHSKIGGFYVISQWLELIFTCVRFIVRTVFRRYV